MTLLSQNFTLPLFVSAALSACVVQQKDSDDLLDAADVADFTIVEGSPTLAPGDSIRIGWNLNAPELFQLELYLSLDSVLDDTDERLLGYGCGADVTDPPGECGGASVCAVEAGQNGPSFHCGDPESPLVHSVALPGLLGGSDGPAVLIVRACNALFEGCDTATLSLTFSAD